MELHRRNPSTEEHQPGSSTSLEEPICQLGFGGDEGPAMYSKRLESMCQLGLGGDEGPAMHSDRPTKPDCTYYIRTGSCRYGDSCRFNHPLDRKVADTNASDGIGKYPEHVGQRTCQFFLNTGTCKYGALCKYDHPRQGGGLAQSIILNIHGYPCRLGEKECSHYVKTGWCKFGSTCKFHHPEISGVAVPSLAPTFYSMVQPPTVPAPRQHTITMPTIFPAPYMQGPYSLMMPFSSEAFPIPRWIPYQGNSVCAYYAQFGRCKYGLACKYDHPEGVLTYSPSMPSPVNMPAVNDPVRFPTPTLAPSSSVSELRSEFTFNEDSLISGMLSSESMSTRSADPMLLEGGLFPHPIAESSDQTCPPASSSTADHSGDVSSSN